MPAAPPPNAIPLQSLPDPTLVTDTEGRVVAANDGVEELFGHEPRRLLGRPVDDLIEGGGALAGGPCTGRHADGRALSLDVRVSGMRSEQGRHLIVAVREAPEPESLLRREREQRLARQSRLFGRVAHDLTNLFAVVRNYTEFVLDGVPTPSQTRDDLVEVVTAAQRGVRLTRQMMSLAVNEPVEPARLVLNDVVGAAEPGLREALGDGVELATRLDPELPAVMIDPAHAERIVQSLVRHGSAAVPAPSRLEVSTARIAGDRVELVVAGASAEPAGGASRPRGKGASELQLATADVLVTRAGGVLAVDDGVPGAIAIRVALPAAG